MARKLLLAIFFIVLTSWDKKEEVSKKTLTFLSHGVGPSKTRSFIIKRRMIWGAMYIYIYIHTVCGMFMYYAWSRYVLSTFRNHGLHSQRGTASCDNGAAVLCFMPAVLFTIFFDNIVLRVTCQLIFIHQNASPHAGHTSKWYKLDQISDKN